LTGLLTISHWSWISFNSRAVWSYESHCNHN
jgi:hypothetical protein